MLSPTCLRQPPTVPSVTVSPSLGIVTTHSSLIAVSPEVSAVQGTAGESDHGFADGLGEARVGVDQPSDITRQRLPVDGQVALVHELTGPGADHVETEDRAVALAAPLPQASGPPRNHAPPVPGLQGLVDPTSEAAPPGPGPRHALPRP